MAVAKNPDEPCTKCGVIHDPTRCQAHSRNRSGEQCGRWPVKGLVVCMTHGGRARQAKAAGAMRTLEEESRKVLGLLSITPVENPLVALQELAGEVVAWKGLMAEKVAELERLRYGTDGGEAIRGEVILFERAMDRCAQVLGLIAKLNIDERLVAVTEQQQRMVLTAINAGLMSIGATEQQANEAKQVAARHLRLVASA